MPVPSLFFIGENGIPLEIIVGNITAVELASKIDSVLTKVGKSNKQSSMNLIDAEQKAAASASSSNNIAESTACDANETKVKSSTDIVSNPSDNSNNEKDEAKATTSGNTMENQDKDNEESSTKSAETEEESQTNKELTAEVSGPCYKRKHNLLQLWRKLQSYAHMFRKNWKERAS